MKICLGQINTTPGDFAGNFRRIQAGITRAAQSGADLVVFPELSIPGYLSQDLVYHPEYLQMNLQYLDRVKQHAESVSPNLYVVVGYIDANRSGAGKPFFNSAAVLRGGEVLATYHKQLLPFYDVFDELRYFEPGTDLVLLDIAGRRVGIAICEDLWNDKGSDGYSYRNNPLERYRQAGADTIVSLNSSPYIQGKPWQRVQHMASASAGGISIVYVNQRGGQDELVFDGNSFVLLDGNLIHLSSDPFEDSFDIVDLMARPDPVIANVGRAENRSLLEDKTATLFDMLVLCLQDYVHKSGFEEIVVASSGGVDSALVTVLACAAVGAGKVHAIRLPSIFSSDASRDDARELHGNLGCWDYEVPIAHEPMVAALNSRFAIHRDAQSNLVGRLLLKRQYNSVADENIQARLRDLYVMHFSNAFGALPLATGNKTESACGYYTHYDMNFAFAPIKDLYKFQVVDLVRGNQQVPENIWRKPPTAELAAGQEDEKALLPYACLDPIVKSHIENYISTFPLFKQWVDGAVSRGEAITGQLAALRSWLESSEAEDDYNRIISLISRMEYKRRQTCPGTKVSRVAFGIGRRIPVVEKWSSNDRH